MTGTELTFFSSWRLLLRYWDRNDGRRVAKEKICLRNEDSLSAHEFAEESDGTPRLFDFIDLLLTNDCDAALTGFVGADRVPASIDLLGGRQPALTARGDASED